MRRYSNQANLSDLLERCLAVSVMASVIRPRPEPPHRIADRLTEADRMCIVQLHTRGEATLKELSKRYGLCINSVRKVIQLSAPNG
jgi:transposase-like protein